MVRRDTDIRMNHASVTFHPGRGDVTHVIKGWRAHVGTQMELIARVN